jgi:hypothetical protein
MRRASVVGRFPYKEGVEGSSPSTPTISPSRRPYNLALCQLSRAP